MRMVNQAGEAIYYNIVEKRGEIRYIVKAASGQVLTGRDRQKLKSRTLSSGALNGNCTLARTPIATKHNAAETYSVLR